MATAAGFVEPLNLFEHFTIFCAGNQSGSTVIRGSIDDVNQIALDEQAPHGAEVGPLISGIWPDWLKNLDAVVRAIGHVDTALRIDCDAVRHIELARTGPFAAPPLDELAILREFNNTRVRTFAIGDEDVLRSLRPYGRPYH